MKHGSPHTVLFDLHLTERSGTVKILSDRTRAELHIRHRQILSVDAVPNLLEGLAPRFPEGIALEGGLSSALPLAINAGVPVDDVLMVACRGLGSFLARLIGEGATAWVEPLRPEADLGLTLPLPLMDVIVRGMRTMRSPELVALELAADLDKPLIVDTVDDAVLEDLDGSALDCVRRCRSFSRLRDAVDSLKHARRGQVREFWWSLDLLLQLELIEIRGSRRSEIVSQSRAAPPVADQGPPKPPAFLSDFDEGEGDEDEDGPPAPPAFLLELERQYQSVDIQLDGQWSGTASEHDEASPPSLPPAAPAPAVEPPQEFEPVVSTSEHLASERPAPDPPGPTADEEGSFHFGADVVEALTHQPSQLEDFVPEPAEPASQPPEPSEPPSESEELLPPSSGVASDDYFEAGLSQSEVESVAPEAPTPVVLGLAGSAPQEAAGEGPGSDQPSVSEASVASEGPISEVDPAAVEQVGMAPVLIQLGASESSVDQEAPIEEAEPEPVVESVPGEEPEAEPEPEPEPEPEEEPGPDLPEAISVGEEDAVEALEAISVGEEEPLEVEPDPDPEPVVAAEPERARSLWDRLRSLLGSPESEGESAPAPVPAAAPPAEPAPTEELPADTTELYTAIDTSALEPLADDLVEALATDELPTELAGGSPVFQVGFLSDSAAIEEALDSVVSEVSVDTAPPPSGGTSVREAPRNAFVAHVRVRPFLAPAWRSVPPGHLSEVELRGYLSRRRSENPLENLGYGPQESTAYLSLEDLLSRVERIVPHCDPSAYPAGSVRQAARELGERVLELQNALAHPAQLAQHLQALRELATPPRGSKQVRGMASEHFTEAQAFASVGDWSAAMEAIRRAGFLDPGNPQMPVFEVACLVALDRLPLADALVNLDSFVCPDDRSEARVHLVAGHLLYRAGQLVEADNRLTRVQKLDSTFDVTHAWMSQSPGPETTALSEVLVNQFSPLE